MVTWFQLNQPFLRASVSVLAVMVLSTAAMAEDEDLVGELYGDVVVDDSGSDGEVVVDDEMMNTGDYDGDEGDGRGEDTSYLERGPESDCGGCEMQAFGGQPELDYATSDLNGESDEFALGPDVCLQPGSIGWLCDWQKGALGQ